MSDIDNDPRWTAAAIDEIQGRASEAHARALERKANAIALLVNANKFTRNSVVQAVTSDDFSLLESSSTPPRKITAS